MSKKNNIIIPPHTPSTKRMYVATPTDNSDDTVKETKKDSMINTHIGEMVDKLEALRAFVIAHIYHDRKDGSTVGIVFDIEDSSTLYTMIRELQDNAKTIEKIQKYGTADDTVALIKGDRTIEQIPHNDRVNHPSHYTWLKDLCGIEVIDITRHLNFNLGNCLKYLLRAGHKFEKGLNAKEKHIEDLKKAEFYIKDEIKRLEEEK